MSSTVIFAVPPFPEESRCSEAGSETQCRGGRSRLRVVRGKREVDEQRNRHADARSSDVPRKVLPGRISPGAQVVELLASAEGERKSPTHRCPLRTPVEEKTGRAVTARGEPRRNPEVEGLVPPPPRIIVRGVCRPSGDRQGERGQAGAKQTSSHGSSSGAG